MGLFSKSKKSVITESAVYWEINLADKIKKLSRGVIDISEDWTVSLSIDSNLRNKLDKEGVVDVLQDMVNEAQKTSDRAARKVIDIWKASANKSARRRLSPYEQIKLMEEKVKVRERFNRNSEPVIRRLKSDLENIPGKRWEQFQQTKKEYRSYKIKAGVKVGVTTGGLALAVGSTAASVPTGGVSIALTVIGLQRTVFSLIEQIRDLSYEGEKVLENLAADIESLEKTAGHSGKSRGHRRRRGSHKHQNVGALRGREIGSNLVKGAMGGLNPTASIKGCADNLDLLRNKTHGVMEKSNKLASKINELLDATQKLNEHVGTRTFSPNKQLKVEKMIAANESAIHATINKCIDTRQRWKTLELSLPRLKKRIDNLEKTAGKNLVKGAAFIPVLMDLGLSAGGAEDAFSGIDHTWQLVTSLVSTTMDVVSVSADAADIALG